MCHAISLKRQPRILVVTSTFPRWPKDNEPRFILDLCRHLADFAEIRVLAPHAPGAAIEETLEGVDVTRFRYFFERWQSVTYAGGIVGRIRQNPWRLLQVPLFLAGLWLALRRLQREWKPDVIHAHWIIPQAFVAALACRGTIPILCTSHGGDLHGLQNRLFRVLKSWTLRRCAATTVVSRSMLTHVRALTGSDLAEVIPMGTDLSYRFVPPAKPAERERRHIVFVGRLVEKKGLEYLLDALAVTNDRELRLTVAGDGPLKQTLLRRTEALGIAEQVTFLGGVEHSQLPPLYQRATIAVFPFTIATDGDQEGFGLVVVEAMGCGCPVIAGDVPAVHETIEHMVTGLLTPAGDVRALADAIHLTLKDKQLRTKLSRTALARVRERYDWPVIAERYHRTIAQLIQNSA